MGRYVIRRLLLAVPIVVTITFLVFLMRVLVPGDPVEVMLMGQAADRATIEAIRHKLGMDRPVLEQYALYLLGILEGDLGQSLKSDRPVTVEIRARYPYTLLLSITSLLVAVLIGLPLGVISALRRESPLDAAATGVTVLGMSMPSFWLGLILISIVSVRWGLLPVMGSESWRHLILPSLTLGSISSAYIGRMVRSGMLEVLQVEYVRTARAKGLPEGAVVIKHALRNALLPVVTILGLQFGVMLSGAFIVEVVFAWHGIGELAVQAIQARDFPLVQGIVVVVAITYVLVNLAVDLLYAWIDPRVILR